MIFATVLSALGLGGCHGTPGEAGPSCAADLKAEKIVQVKYGCNHMDQMEDFRFDLWETQDGKVLYSALCGSQNRDILIQQQDRELAQQQMAKLRELVETEQLVEWLWKQPPLLDRPDVSDRTTSTLCICWQDGTERTAEAVQAVSNALEQFMRSCALQ